MHTETEKQLLLKLASDSIEYGLQNHKIMPTNINEFPENLRGQGASFVTLQINKQLRGCIGSLQTYQPLIKDLVHNAYAAAFSDPRFPPLTQEEFSNIDIHISILSKPEPMQFTSEQNLISQLRPEIDGLILSDNGHRGTFLPSVWESLPEPKLFLSHLKLKAGLPQNYWSDTLTVQRYTVESIP